LAGQHGPCGRAGGLQAAAAALGSSSAAALGLLGQQLRARVDEEVCPAHVELLGHETSFAGTFDMMNEELRQPATARARDCQAVR